MNLKSFDRFSKNNQTRIFNFTKISQVVVELFHPKRRKDRQTDRQTDSYDRTKPLVAVGNFMSRLKKPA
jgi:hypothetical protein